MNLVQEYKYLVQTQREIQKDLDVCNDRIIQMRKIPKCQGELSRFNKKYDPYNTRFELQREVTKIDRKLYRMENEVIGYDKSPTENKEFMKMFAEFFKEEE